MTELYDALEDCLEALARGAYAALAKVLHEMKPEEVFHEVELSGLRGRGGGGRRGR